MRVVPEKSERRSDERAAKNSELAHLGQMRDIQILREPREAGHICQNSERPGGDHHAPDREAVQAVRQIHGVGRPDNDQRNENQKWKIGKPPKILRGKKRMNDQVWMKIL